MSKSLRPLSHRILEARQRAGMTITEVAEKANVSYGTLWNWEAGRCVPAPAAPALKRVADVLRLPKVAVAHPC